MNDRMGPIPPVSLASKSMWLLWLSWKQNSSSSYQRVWQVCPEVRDVELCGGSATALVLPHVSDP